MELATQLVLENKNLRDETIQKVLFSIPNLKQARKSDTSNRKASNFLGDVITELSAENKLLTNF